jgi:hypothetical protein
LARQHRQAPGIRERRARDSRDLRDSRDGQGSESHESHESHGVTADTDTIDIELEAAELIRRSGVERLVVADLDLDTLFNVTWFAKLGTAARPGLQVWFRALAAAKRSTSGLGLASAPAGHEHLVAVARRGQWSRLLTIEKKVDSLALVEHLLLLAKQDGHGRTIEPLPATAD